MADNSKPQARKRITKSQIDDGGPMAPGTEDAVMVYVSCPDRETAEQIGRQLVVARWAACVNIWGDMTSIYRWDAHIERGQEAVMIVKTTARRAAAVVAEISKLHPYTTPGVVVLPIIGGDAGYLRWILSETAPDDDPGSTSVS